MDPKLRSLGWKGKALNKSFQKKKKRVSWNRTFPIWFLTSMSCVCFVCSQSHACQSCLESAEVSAPKHRSSGGKWGEFRPSWGPCQTKCLNNTNHMFGTIEFTKRFYTNRPDLTASQRLNWGSHKALLASSPVLSVITLLGRFLQRQPLSPGVWSAVSGVWLINQDFKYMLISSNHEPFPKGIFKNSLPSLPSSRRTLKTIW